MFIFFKCYFPLANHWFKYEIIIYYITFKRNAGEGEIDQGQVKTAEYDQGRKLHTDICSQASILSSFFFFLICTFLVNLTSLWDSWLTQSTTTYTACPSVCTEAARQIYLSITPCRPLRYLGHVKLSVTLMSVIILNKNFNIKYD